MIPELGPRATPSWPSFQGMQAPLSFTELPQTAPAPQEGVNTSWLVQFSGPGAHTSARPGQKQQQNSETPRGTAWEAVTLVLV